MKKYNVDGVRALMLGWSVAEGRAWRGDPSATTAWLKAAVHHCRGGRFLPLGDPASPLGCLWLTPSTGALFAGPVGWHADRFAPCPGADPDAFLTVLRQSLGPRLALLPFCEPAIAATARIVRGFAVRSHDVAGLIPAQEPDDYERRRPKRLRQTFTAGRRHLLNLNGEIRLLEAGTLKRIWPSLVAVEEAGHRPHGHILGGPHGAFLRDALTALDTQGRIQLWLASVAGEPSSYLVVCVAPQRALFYTMAMHRRGADLNLGSLVFIEAIRHNLHAGRDVDLGTGWTPFKARFADIVVPLADVVAAPQPVADALQRLLSRTPRHPPLPQEGP